MILGWRTGPKPRLVHRVDKRVLMAYNPAMGNGERLLVLIRSPNGRFYYVAGGGGERGGQSPTRSGVLEPGEPFGGRCLGGLRESASDIRENHTFIERSFLVELVRRGKGLKWLELT